MNGQRDEPVIKNRLQHVIFVDVIKELRIKNFKAWADSGKIRMAPLTIFCGNNSSGKSSIAQFLLMLKQTVESFDRQRVLHTGDTGSLVDLGTFQDIIHKHVESEILEFGFIFDTEPLRISNAVTDKTVGVYSKLFFNANIVFDKKSNKTVLESLCYKLLNQEELEFRLNLEQGKYRLEPTNYQAIRQKGRAWHLPHPENFFGFPDEAIAYYQNTSFLQDLSLSMKNFFKSIYYVGPLRDYPERFYQFSGEVPPHVGEKGTLAVNALLAARGRKLSRGFKMKSEKFEELIARWLKDLGLIYSFNIVPIGTGRKEYEVRIKVNKDAVDVLITDVGFGISQVLPVVVQCFYVTPKSILFFEQPEIHLHPSVQSNLGDLFIEAINAREKGNDRNVQIIVESHSEHLIRRIQRRIAEKVITPEDIAIYFIKQEKGEARLDELSIDIFGNVTNWPENFFGNEIEDLAAMTRAARKRKIGNE